MKRGKREREEKGKREKVIRVKWEMREMKKGEMGKRKVSSYIRDFYTVSIYI